MNGVDLFLLGRTLTRIGEAAMPAPREDASRRHGGSTRSVLTVASDVAVHPDSAVGEIAARTGLPQSAVSTAVARLREAGAVVTTPDPADRRRILVRQSPDVSDRVAEVRATSIEAALAAALGEEATPERLTEITAALETLSRHLTPDASARLRG